MASPNDDSLTLLPCVVGDLLTVAGWHVKYSGWRDAEVASDGGNTTCE